MARPLRHTPDRPPPFPERRPAPAGPGFSKRSYRLAGFVRDLAGLAPHAPALARGALGGGRLGPLLREEIFTAVARANRCRYCSYIHEGFAGLAGASDTELAALEGTDPGGFDRGRWVALQYARAWLAGRVEPALEAEARRRYDEKALSEIRAAAAVMDFTSQCGNTVDSLLARLREPGGGRPDAQAWEEALIAALSAPIGGPGLLLSALARGVRHLRLGGRRGVRDRGAPPS